MGYWERDSLYEASGLVVEEGGALRGANAAGGIETSDVVVGVGAAIGGANQGSRSRHGD